MQPLPGFRDFFPTPLPTRDAWSAELRQHIFSVWRQTARRYGFREYDGPPLEPVELYTIKSGDEIVQQLFNFVDKGERHVSLRPEMTPTVARMVAASERAYKKPIKWFSIPQLFRYEKQQKGRLREHFQFNADIFGEADVSADAEIVALLIDSLRALGLGADDFVVRLSSRQAWQRFFSAHGGREEDTGQFFLAVDKLEREKPEVSAAKLTELGINDADVRRFIDESPAEPELEGVLENLTARGLGAFAKIDYGVIRGLAYYTGIVFEAFDRQGEFRAIAGGGRYDQLIGKVSGGKVDLPGLGFGMGDVVLTELIKARGRAPESADGLDAFVLIEDESLRVGSLRVIQSHREAGMAVDFALTPTKSDKQFKRALDLGAKRTIRLEKTPEGLVLAKVKTLSTRAETAMDVGAIVESLRAGQLP